MSNGNTTLRLEAYFEDPALLESQLFPSEDQTYQDIKLENGIGLKPLFLSPRSSPVVGGDLALAFLITTASGIAAKALAEVIFKWLKKTKASRVKIERIEVSITRPEEVIRIVQEVVEKDLD